MRIEIFVLKLFIILFAFSNVLGSDRRSVPIDGSNSFTYDSSRYLFNSNVSIITGAKNDSFYEIYNDTDFTSKHKIMPNINLSGSLGAETGDPLFNQYRYDSSLPNRDHRTLFFMEGMLPQMPLMFAYHYRYNDTYSDRYDSLWSNYNNVNNQKMKYDEVGLSNENYGLIRYQYKDIYMQTSINKYEQWGATPYFFSPIFIKGYSVVPSLRYSFKSLIFKTDCLIDRYSRYYDHINSSHEDNIIGDCSFEWRSNSKIKSYVKFHYNNLKTPKASVSVSLFTNKTRLRLGCTSMVFSDYNMGISCYGAFLINQNYLCSLSISRDHIPAERPYKFTEVAKSVQSVQYEPLLFDQNSIYSSITYKDTICYPVSFSLWYQYCSDPLWESIIFDSNSTIIQQKINKSSARSIAGFFGSYIISYNSLSLKFTPNFMFPVEFLPMRFKLEKTAVLDISYSDGKPNSISATMSIICKDHVSLNYLVNGNIDSIQTFRSPSFVSANVNIRIPIVVPIVNPLFQNTAFIVDAGPLRFSRKQRLREHPQGNYIGPAIYAGFDGRI